MAQIEQIVEEIIKNNKIAVFSKSYCPYCTRAKKALEGLKLDFFHIELDNEEDGAAIQQYLLEKTGQRTVPNIFINQKHVGGSDDLMQAISSGNINQLLKA
ncbi:hypothetical protein G6F57_011037 [Rhizopus arrhizus]|uniref:Glutaredoxin domain-containing protein n=1 Tax=Rhizopus oryzae TaxID=64495 RepID=A0A9P7BN73_RHIOR|nr:hypothetical protein G6F23_010709 [Rhizopus arrhizus]KAG1398774.1 hypothetical protein G6F58_011253 [Rhizopus delemar]KAG0756668.1 hypothetical protein G6F24_010991 [Rhizopus arrhizus]KAG0789146.1 hypothetical protein G6F21_006712 [Rhizopus arrhizus]KAG0790260.1 hypothetical protein G6F22_006461 [Rhizopus arrhizus]